MTIKLPPTVSQYLAQIGAKGGRKGKGKSKVRSTEAHRKAGIASGKARRAKKLNGA